VLFFDRECFFCAVSGTNPFGGSRQQAELKQLVALSAIAEMSFLVRGKFKSEP
jgi:hypothetical protein